MSATFHPCKHCGVGAAGHRLVDGELRCQPTESKSQPTLSKGTTYEAEEQRAEVVEPAVTIQMQSEPSSYAKLRELWEADNNGPWLQPKIGVGIGGRVLKRDPDNPNVITRFALDHADFVFSRNYRYTREDIQDGVDDLVSERVPVGVWCAGLVLSTKRGWRHCVLRFAMWLIRKTGHEVIEPRALE